MYNEKEILTVLEKLHCRHLKKTPEEKGLMFKQKRIKWGQALLSFYFYSDIMR